MAMKWDAVLKSAKNDLASSVADGVKVGDVEEWLDTGCYTLNALISGSIFGGIPEGKVTGLAAESATGKTFIALQTVKGFLEKYDGSACFYFESEGAITQKMIIDRGIDSKRLFIVPVATVQEFRTQAKRILTEYSKTPENERPRMMFVLDSLGNLSTEKSVEDAQTGNNARDMTKTQLLKSAFSVITLELARLKVPMIVTAHTYQTMDQYSPKEIGGGSGLKYCASTIVMLYKRMWKDKTSGEFLGNNLRCYAYKSRFTKEKSELQVGLRQEGGLDRYYGLVDLALMTGVFKEDTKRIVLPDGKKVFGKTINDNPKEYFTDEILKMIDEKVPSILCYSSTLDESLPTLEEVEDLNNIQELNEVEE